LRSVGGELLSVSAVLAIPACIVASFPFGAFGFRASEDVRRPGGTVAFVRLDPETERVALRTARASWQTKGGDARRLQADLLLSELPDDGRLSVLTVRDRSRPPDPPFLLRGRTPFLPSQKASPPSPIRSGNAVERPAFPREELLKLN